MTVVLLSAVSLIILHFILYPLSLLLLWLLSGRPRGGTGSGFPEDGWPSVSVLISARDEASSIARRIENILQSDYPSSVEILVGSDASTDETAEIVAAYADSGVRLLVSSERLGKPLMLQRLEEISTGEVLVFTDADTSFARGTIRELVYPMSDPSIGCVDGSRVNSLDEERCESVYWRYEKWIKRLCSGLGAVLGATGAVFAIRRSLFKPLSKRRADDFELAVMVRIAGHRCVFNPEAVAMEPSPDDRRQFMRVMRISSWMVTSAIMLTGKALGSGKLLLALQIFLHKILRWLVGTLLLLITVLVALKADEPLFMATLLALLSFHFLALVAIPLKSRMPSILCFPYYFWLMNSASTIGIVRAMAGRPVEKW